jgi:signal transduction histidine kinase
MLRDFIATCRDDILARAREKVTTRRAPTDAFLTYGLPAFLDQLGEALRRASALEALDHVEIERSARRHGDELFRHGLTVGQAVHDYGDLCQIITGLAGERAIPIAVEDFRTLNLCLDDAIAGAVTAYGRRRDRALADEETERLGILAHEMRNALNTAILSFTSIKRGLVAPGGSTGAIHELSLTRLSNLLDRTLAEVRLEESGTHLVEHVSVWEVIEEVEISASLAAGAKGLHLVVESVDRTLAVEGDRQILAAAIANLLQNALKFTKPSSTVQLRTLTTETRVLIEVEDECGGLPPEAPRTLLKPFVQRGHDRTGLGLGLTICLKAVTSMAGELHLRDLPGKGCIFTIDLPRQPPPPTSIHAKKGTLGAPQGGTGGIALRAG